MTTSAPSQTPPTAADFAAARRDPARVQAIAPVGPRAPTRRPVTNFLKASIILGALWMAGQAVSNWVSGPDAAPQPHPEPQTVAQVTNAPALSANAERANRLARQVAGLASAPRPARTAPGLLPEAPAPEPSVTAVIDASVGDGHNDLIRKFQRTGLRDFPSAFQALSLQAEGLELSAYNAGENRSAANATIGVGYHIPSNLRDLGRAKVLEEFRQAGISASDSADLVSGDPDRMSGVKITPKQALSLLAVTMPRYQSAVVGRLGQDNWRRLGQIAGPEGQAGVVWSAYNGAFWQHADETIQAIRSGDRLAIAESIRGTAQINGKSQENHNLSLARAAVASRDTFNYAIGYGNRSGADARVAALAKPTAPAPPRPLRSDPSAAASSIDASVAVEQGRVQTNFGGQPAYDPRYDPLRQPSDLRATGRAAAVEFSPAEPIPAPRGRTRLNQDAFQDASPAPAPVPAAPATPMRP